MRFIIGLISAMSIGVIVVIVLGYLSFLHPLFDSMSHFRIHLLFLLSFLLFIRFTRVSIVFSLIVAMYLVYITDLLSPKISNIPEESLHMMQFNLNFRNRKIGDVKNYLISNDIDIATFQEVTKRHENDLQGLIDIFPYQKYCAFQAVGGVAILSKYPFVKGQDICKENGLVKTEIMFKDKKINIVSIHLYWPYPYQQYKQVAELDKILSTLRGATVVAGDFNAAGWSHILKKIEKSSNTDIVAGIRFSINLPFHMMLPLDHVLVTKDLKIEDIYVEKSLGSDHLPIIYRIGYKDD